MDSRSQPTIDVIVPLYNEERCFATLHERLAQLRLAYANDFDLRAIYVDDGSSDLTRDFLRTAAMQSSWVTSILLSRNFGHQIAVTAGLDASKSDYAAIIDGDLQDPPELIPIMLKQLKSEDVQVVYGRRTSRHGESRFKKLTASVFYRATRTISGIPIPVDTGDFRVMTGFAVSTLRQMREKDRFLRGMIPWLGLTSRPFDYERDPRFAGTTKYTLRKMVRLATNAVVGFSLFPLRVVQLFGLVLLMIGGLGLLVSIVSLSLSNSINYEIWLLLIVVSLAGSTVSAVGIVGGYVHRIQDEVRGRPMYVIEKTLGEQYE